MTVLIVLLIFCSVSAVPETPDYYSPDSVLLFADHLFRQQDYLRAAYEYERYGFLQTGNDPADREILLRAGKAFQCAGEYDRSLDLFAVLIETAGSNRIRELAICETGLTYFRMARYQESLLFLQGQPLERLLPEAGLLVGANLMMLGQWRLAALWVAMNRSLKPAKVCPSCVMNSTPRIQNIRRFTIACMPSTSYCMTISVGARTML